MFKRIEEQPTQCSLCKNAIYAGEDTYVIEKCRVFIRDSSTELREDCGWEAYECDEFILDYDALHNLMIAMDKEVMKLRDKMWPNYSYTPKEYNNYLSGFVQCIEFLKCLTNWRSIFQHKQTSSLLSWMCDACFGKLVRKDKLYSWDIDDLNECCRAILESAPEDE